MTATATAMSQRAGARIRDVSFVFCFSCASLGIVVAFAVLLGTISSYNGEDHLVDTAPRYVIPCSMQCAAISCGIEAMRSYIMRY